MEKVIFDKFTVFSNLENFQAMAYHDFLEDWEIGKVMERKMVVGWAAGQAHLGGTFSVLQTQFYSLFFVLF